MEGGDPGWREGTVGAIFLGAGTGTLAGFGRFDDENGEVYWEKRQVPAPGKLGEPTADRERLSPRDLLEALRGPLGA